MNRHKRELILTIAAILLIGGVGMITIVLMFRGNCNHGHHVGICGREFRIQIGKVSSVRICECQKDHY